MVTSSDISALPSRRESWIAPVYFVAYLVYLFLARESELLHWLSLVTIPLLIVILFKDPGTRTPGAVLASLGLRRGNLTRGVGWAILLGLTFSVFQAFFTSKSADIQELILTGKALYLYPITFLLMMMMAGFTEEFFFRGFLQTRLETLVRSKWLAVLIVMLLFGVYHLPYAYFNPNWPSSGDWGAAWGAAMGSVSSTSNRAETW
jgi:membrane protease YdiL (CAAX protease family)